MKKLFNILIVSAIIAAGVVGVKLQNEKTVKAPMRDITLANLNALLGTESDTEKDNTDPEKDNTDPEKDPSDPEKSPTIKKVFYKSIHVPVYKNNVKTKMCTATCYESPYSQNPICHKHAAKECCYEK